MSLEINRFIDHTLLKPSATKDDISKLCQEARLYRFFSVCINPDFVSYAKECLQSSDVKVCTVIGFPLGASTTETKVFETTNAINNGADEIDMVINISKVKEHDYQYVEEEIKEIKKACGNKLLKVILETCLLKDNEIINSCRAAKNAHADFVKTSTGFSTGGATVEDVALMRKTVGNALGVKASGGVRTREDALKMIEAGATRIGTSNGLAIIK